ncbi:MULTISPECIES: methylmalonyl-CoA epimerase [Streptomyces]|uniref:Methylmalonyl-CoA epimerase n=1 Tax=Streptomyces cacaoi TaxID=1898 RepID=A0A4Y3QRC1_STRCI|nr:MULTISPECIES: methylmalonyl-CoA epimerase [Streptomyces]ATJ34000.1 methylmalonyl-CoA epimerase [Streptomyces sp.]NNG88816.1 methylmalonyl-CoA epimerase [Streptomyces cacaoi]GEB47742.1 methylmalonyl-CoA epimerase [Streptomyces cacaoi]
MITRIDHIGIACHDLDETVDFYRRTWGLEVHHTQVIEEQGVREAMLRVNGTDDGNACWLQLLEPVREDCAVATWLERHGEGVHHIAFGTPDVDAAAGAAGEAGIRVVFDPPRTGSMDSRVTFLHPKDCHGVLTELVTSAGDLARRGARPVE